MNRFFFSETPNIYLCTMNKLIQKYIFSTFRSSILSSIVYTSSLQHWLLNKWECLAAFAAAVADYGRTTKMLCFKTKPVLKPPLPPTSNECTNHSYDNCSIYKCMHCASASVYYASIMVKWMNKAERNGERNPNWECILDLVQLVSEIEVGAQDYW